MTHREVLHDLAQRGLRVSPAGEQLRLQGPKERIDAELTQRIRLHKREILAELTAPPAGGDGYGLTPLQRGYLVGRGEEFEIGNVASYVFHEIEGSWDVEALERALQQVIGAHDALRTRFPGPKEQIPDLSGQVSIERIDLRGQDPAQRGRIRHEWSHRILDAARGPLLAVAVAETDEGMVLFVGHDGLVMDGISMFLFFRAWHRAYTGGTGVPELPFGQYVAALAADADRAPAQRSREYWLGRLEELPPAPELPLANGPETIRHPRFGQQQVRLDAPTWARVRAKAAEAGVTPSAVLLTAYAQTLVTWGSAPQLSLITTVAQRPPIHPRALEAIGPFSDTVLLALDGDRSRSFADRAAATQARLRKDLDNRHFSGGQVMAELRRRGRGSMPYTFNSAIDYPVAGADGSALELFGTEVFSVSQTPQVWLNAFAMEVSDGLLIQLDSVEELFSPGLVADLAAGYQRLLQTLAEPEAWSGPAPDLLPAQQRERRRQANDTQAEIPPEQAHQAFLRQAHSHPQAPALIAGDRTISYGELHARASQLAARLRRRGIARDELVAVVAERGPAQVVGILAVLLSGGAYLPIDVSHPPARQRWLMEDTRVRAVLSDGSWPSSLSPSWLSGPSTLRIDLDDPAGEPVEVPERPGANPDDLAYVLYTSGTTGRPKGVMISHRSVVNLVVDINRRLALGPQDRLFAISAYTFDLSVYDVFGGLSAGAALVLPEAERAVDPAHWIQVCDRHEVTLWNSVPAIVGLLHEQMRRDASPLKRLRRVLMSGDRIPPDLPARLRSLLPEVEVISLGGPTETTVWNILHPVGVEEDGSRSIPYGCPNSNNRAYLLDAAGFDTPDWVTGEIHAAGTGLARGYWNDEHRTAASFRDDPVRGERLYATGDLGRYRPDGEIEILGRSDFQVKVNGYRIEASEVETRLLALTGIERAVVVRAEGPAGAVLAGHLVGPEPARPGEDEIRRHLADHLPGYMIPSALRWHEELPLTGNGKVDRAALMALPVSALAPRGGAVEGETEQAVAAIWSAVLELEIQDSGLVLAEIGADSIAAARILADVRRRFGVSIPFAELGSVDTVRTMAAHLDERGAVLRSAS